jgi:hypothetical protein
MLEPVKNKFPALVGVRQRDVQRQLGVVKVRVELLVKTDVASLVVDDERAMAVEVGVAEIGEECVADLLQVNGAKGVEERREPDVVEENALIDEYV